MPVDSTDSVNDLRPGTKVRLIRDPQQIGIVGDDWIGAGRRRRVLVTFLSSGEEDHYLPSELEQVTRESNSPNACISNGRYANAGNLRMAITHHRLSGRLANLIYSLNTTNTEFFAYQFKPVLQFLESPSNGILIADEVGLGKTIEAGLIWTELKARVDARRLLVICPAMLRHKWRDELSYRFGVKADIVDAGELLDKLQSVPHRPRQEFAMIASFQGIRPPSNYNNKDNKQAAARLARFLEDHEQRAENILDLLIVDEAHYLRNPETSTHQLGQLMRPLSEYLVLLSATPIQLGSEDLFNLLKILDDSAFPNEFMFEQSMQVARPIVQLRDAVLAGSINQQEFCAGIAQAMDNRFLGDSAQLANLLETPPSDQELRDVRNRSELADRLDRVHPLSKVVTRTLKRDVQINRVVRRAFAKKAELNEIEREFYSRVTTLVREYCEKNNMMVGFILTIPQRQMASSMAAACRAWQQRFETGREEDMSEALYELVDDDLNQVNVEQNSSGDLVRELVQIANEVGSFSILKKNDSKYAELLSNLKDYTSKYPGKKVVLFSFFRHTLNYLHERLGEDGFESIVLMGGMDKQAILEAFRMESGPQILLSSEVASEGVDLQFSSLLINYDLPWNPAKIEQRIGRIDRIGQKDENILIWNLLNKDTIDDRIYDRLLVRLDVFEQTLGSMESTLGKEIHSLTKELFQHQLTAEEEVSRIERTEFAIEEIKRQNAVLESEAENLVAHGDFILNKVQAANELGRYIRGEDLYVYVGDFLLEQYDGTRIAPQSDSELLFLCHPSVALRSDFAEFLSQNDLKGSTRLLGDRPLPLLFDNRHGKPSTDFERVGQDHPLVRFVTYKLGDFEQRQSRYPVSAAKLPSSQMPGIPPGDYVFVVNRWSFIGAKTQERLEFIAWPLGGAEHLSTDSAESLVNIAALHGEDWHSASSELDGERVEDLFQDCREQLRVWFDSTSRAMKDENSDKIKLTKSLLQDRCERDVERIDERIRNMEASGRTRMLNAEEGKKNAAKRRLEQRLSDLITKERFKTEQKFVTGGVIRIY